MTQTSLPWQGTVVGDAGVYNAATWSTFWKNITQGANGLSIGDAGVIANSGDGSSPPLSVLQTATASTSVRVTPGSAMVNGRYYRNDSDSNVLIQSNSSGSTRYDLVVLRADYTSQTVRAVAKQGSDTAYPALQQDTSIYELPLAKVRVPDGFTEIESNDLIPFRYPKVNTWEQVTRGLSLHIEVGGDEITVSPGQTWVDGEHVSIENAVTMDIDTDANWIDEDKPVSFDDIYIQVYINPLGEIKLSQYWPYFGRPYYDDAVGLYNVDSGGALNATSLTVTELTNFVTDYNVANIERGDFAFVFSDFSTLAGRSRNNALTFGGTRAWSIAYVDSISGSTLTLLSGHNINITNNDDILIVKNRGRIQYLPSTRDFAPNPDTDMNGSTWWKLIGSVFNVSSTADLAYTDRMQTTYLASDVNRNGTTVWNVFSVDMNTICVWNEDERPMLSANFSISETSASITRVAISYRIGGLQMGVVASNDDGLWFLNPTTTSQVVTANLSRSLRALNYYDKLPPGVWRLDWYTLEDAVASTVIIEGTPTVGDVRFQATINNYRE